MLLPAQHRRRRRLRGSNARVDARQGGRAPTPRRRSDEEDEREPSGQQRKEGKEGEGERGEGVLCNSVSACRGSLFVSVPFWPSPLDDDSSLIALLTTHEHYSSSLLARFYPARARATRLNLDVLSLLRFDLCAS